MLQAEILPYIKVMDTFNYFMPTDLDDEFMKYALPKFEMRNGKGESQEVYFRDCTIEDFKGNEHIYKKQGGELNALKCPSNQTSLKVKNNQYSMPGDDWTQFYIMLAECPKGWGLNCEEDP